MEKSSNLSKLSRVASFAALLALAGVGFAQAQSATVPDAQIESNVLKTLAGSSILADQSISTTTVYGTVTLSGTVRDEASRDLAEKLVSTTEGVKKVVDELTVGTSAPAATTGVPQQPENPADQGTNPNLQSDGTMAPSTPQQTQSAPPQQTQPAPPQSYPGNSAPPQASVQQPPPPTPYVPYRQPYARPYGPPPSGYSQQQPYAYPPQQPMVAQKGGDAVIVAAGTVLRVRINQGMDSRKTAPGTAFDGVVLSDVVAGGSIAIPRGATVQGVVNDVQNAGQFKGRGELSLQLTQVNLGGQTYPLVTTPWSQQGADKTGATVGNTIGLGAVGAMIGAVAGGGVGAAVGAGVGGVTGLVASSASHRGEVWIPAEAILSFSLTQPTELTTVSQAELNRLGAGVPVGGQPGQLQRRYPPPPPAYYGPAYYYPRY
jgi:hypothetical protein